jgi:hypothetical protein
VVEADDGGGTNPGVSEPTRVDALSNACFQLVEMCAALERVHVNKHQEVRRFVEGSPEAFGAEGRTVWECFQELENRVRPGQAYGGAIDGRALAKAVELHERIRAVCMRVIERRGR